MKALLVLSVIYIVIEIINYTTKKYGFNGLHYSRNISSTRIFAGDTFVLSSEIVNKKLLPVPFAEITEKMPAEFEYEIKDSTYSSLGYIYHNNVLALLPFQRVVRKYRIKCSTRGRYYFSDVKISIGDFFGFRTYTKDIENALEILAYPRIEPLNQLLVDYKNPQGDISVRRWIMDDPNIISGIREYTQSDPFNRIHWPSTARRGELTVKNFDYTSSQKAVILLNIETAKPFWAKINGDKVERVIKITASLSDELLKKGMEVGLFTNASLGGYRHHEGNYIHPSCSPGQLQRILEALARIDYSIQQTFEELLSKVLQEPVGDRHYIMVTPIVTEELGGLVRILERRHCRVTLVTFEGEDIRYISESVDKFLAKEGGIELEAV